MMLLTASIKLQGYQEIEVAYSAGKSPSILVRLCSSKRDSSGFAGTMETRGTKCSAFSRKKMDLLNLHTARCQCNNKENSTEIYEDEKTHLIKHFIWTIQQLPSVQKAVSFVACTKESRATEELPTQTN
jgi:hypothetical protein